MTKFNGNSVRGTSAFVSFILVWLRIQHDHVVNGSALIVGNTRNNTFPAYRVDPITGEVAEFITAASTNAILENPDFFKVYDNLLYGTSIVLNCSVFLIERVLNKIRYNK
jgi:hypothetical protein